MSVSAVSAVLERSKAKGLARLVFVCIAERIGKDGRAWCGLRDIGKRAAIESRNVPRLIKELQQLGELLVVGINTTTKSNVYQISPSLMVRLRRKSHGKTRGSLMVSKGESHGETSGTARIEPSKEPILPPYPPKRGNGSLLFPESETRKTKPAQRFQYPKEFEELWSAYPDTNASKFDTYQIWKRVQPPLDQCLEAIAIFKKTDNWKRGYVEYPGKWIKGRQWELEEP